MAQTGLLAKGGMERSASGWMEKFGNERKISALMSFPRWNGLSSGASQLVATCRLVLLTKLMDMENSLVLGSLRFEVECITFLELNWNDFWFNIIFFSYKKKWFRSIFQ